MCWQLESKENRIIGKHEDCILSVAISSDDLFIVSGSEDRTIRCWDLET